MGAVVCGADGMVTQEQYDALEKRCRAFEKRCSEIEGQYWIVMQANQVLRDTAYQYERSATISARRLHELQELIRAAGESQWKLFCERATL